MNDRYLEVTYHKGRLLAAYLYLPRRDGDRSVRVQQFPGALVVDLTEDGRPIGVEVTDPLAVSPDQINSALAHYGLQPLSEHELAPLCQAA